MAVSIMRCGDNTPWAERCLASAGIERMRATGRLLKFIYITRVCGRVDMPLFRSHEGNTASGCSSTARLPPTEGNPCETHLKFHFLLIQN